MSQLEFASITKKYGDVTALDNFTLTVPGGKLVSLLGPSGCGKTTALRVAAGFEQVETGRLVAGGHVISHVPPQNRHMGMVFQNYSLFPHMTVLENVMFGLTVRRAEREKKKSQAMDMLGLVQLPHVTDRYPHQLSGGQQQRVALARALVFQPSVLLLDEPLSALDAKVRVEVREVIRDLQTQLGTTTVFVTHDQEEALTISDIVCVMNEGRVQQVGTPREVYDTPANEFVARFVGDSVMVPVAGGNMLSRPENLSVWSEGAAPGDALAVLNGWVEGVDFHGATSDVRIRLHGSDHVVIARVLGSTGSVVRFGERVSVAVHRFFTTL
ncbi:MAG: hypothetical protein RLZZ544_907 [Actinomycetota bacterium]